jgi:purine-binding chemotaxis protein CheW
MSALEQFLVFQLGEAYGITVQNVVEVLEVKVEDVTRIPRTPKYMTGIINNRGKLVPIINLRLQLGMEPLAPVKPLASIVILTFPFKGEEIGLGILVDSVKEVTEFTANEIEPKPRLGTRVQTEFIRGMGNKNGQFTILLDIERIFNIETLARLQNTTVESDFSSASKEEASEDTAGRAL